MITAAPNAPVGQVTRLPFYRPDDFPANSAVLCRNAAPLLSFAFSLLRRSVACHVLGRDIASGLDRLIDRIGGATPQEVLRRLDEFSVRESDKLRKRGKAQEAANLMDRCDCLTLFLEGSPNLGATRFRITDLFRAGPGVTLSTIHKAKGLEWDTVFLLDRDTLQPSRWARAPWERQQEQNLLYVAVTRARLNLFYIKTGGWK